MSRLTRRQMLQVMGAGAVAAVPTADAAAGLRARAAGFVEGHMSGAEALVETLQQLGADWVFGIPGAQENELWDTFKAKHFGYTLVTHEFNAATMADGYARSTGKPGLICVVPGPGLTNSLSGLGEALLDSVPIVAIVGDVGNGAHGRAFQVHCLDNVALLRPVTKCVIAVRTVGDIPAAVQQAYNTALSGEPGPVAVVVPYNLFFENHHYHCAPAEAISVPWDETAYRGILGLLANCRQKVGIYAGMGCMDHSAELTRLAEILQAPVATSMAGKGVICETHPLAVGWGYGPQGTLAAEMAFRQCDVVLAIGVKFSEVSTGFYSDPQPRVLIHVDINRDNLGRVMRTDACLQADSGMFLSRAIADADQIRRPCDDRLVQQIAGWKAAADRSYSETYARCGVDPVLFLRSLRAVTCRNAMAFVDVTVSQYWATEVFTTYEPRTFFNPTNNQAMGWSIGAALGAQRVHGNRQVVTITGDGCFLMSAMEISTAAREALPVKFFVLDDQAYHYMQELQRPAYVRTTATILARLNYRELAAGLGVGYRELTDNGDLDAHIRGILCESGPVLVRVAVDYRRRPIRWIAAARAKYTNELTLDQKVRFLARIGSRSIHLRQDND
jgi:acetolactate synthase I/II/III large subunit